MAFKFILSFCMTCETCFVQFLNIDCSRVQTSFDQTGQISRENRWGATVGGGLSRDFKETRSKKDAQ
jgi:hypothetical protein